MSEILPNDVAIVFRPQFTEGEEWSGDYTAFITGFGPITMEDEDMQHLISAAVLVATAIKLIEEDKEFGERLFEAYKKDMEDTEVTYYSDYEDYKGSFKLGKDTKTKGGMQ